MILGLWTVDATFRGYIEAQRSNLDSALRFELFAATCPRMDRLYRLSVAALTKEMPHVFGQFLLVCHKSFLAAATLIGQAQPDDAGPITRRAIEVVRLAAAMKADPAIAKKWHAYEKRMERWRARREGEKPKRLDVQIPDDHPLMQGLMGIWGVISDTDVHFTPEHFLSLRWEQSYGSVILRYFTGDQRTIESAIITLLGSHMMMLRILDECLDGSFSSNPEWRKLCDQIHASAKPYAEKFEHPTAFEEPGGRSGT